MLLRLFVLAPVGAELVVFPPLLGIAEDLVGLVDLLEARLSALVAGVDVGMVLPGQFPVRLLEFLLGCGLRHTERRVVILEFHS